MGYALLFAALAGVALIFGQRAGVVPDRITSTAPGNQHADGRALITCNVTVAGRSFGVQCPPLDEAALDAIKSGAASIPERVRNAFETFGGWR